MSNQPPKDPRWQPRHWRNSSHPPGTPAGPAGAGRRAAGGATATANPPAGPSGTRPWLEGAWRTALAVRPAARLAPPIVAGPDWPSPVAPPELAAAPGAEAEAPGALAQPRRARGFVPMDAILTGRPQNSDLPAEEREALGFSRNYQGDPLNPRNRAPDIPEDESTSLYIQHLPPGITDKRLLDELQRHGPFGRVNQTWVRHQDPNRSHRFSAAKLVMFERHEAEAVFDFVQSGGLVFDGFRTIIRWNTQRVRPRSMTADPKNWYMRRALRISGPKELVDVRVLYDHWTRRLQFTTQDVFVLAEDDNIRVLIWVFGSLLNQAELAFLALKEWNPEGGIEPDFEFRYASDPMELDPGATSRFRSVVNLVPSLDNFNRAARQPLGLPAPALPMLALPAPPPPSQAPSGNQVAPRPHNPFAPPFRLAAPVQHTPPTGPALTCNLPIRPAPGVQRAPPNAPTGPALLPVARAPANQQAASQTVPSGPRSVGMQGRQLALIQPVIPLYPIRPAPTNQQTAPVPAPCYGQPRVLPTQEPQLLPVAPAQPRPAAAPVPEQPPAINKQAEEHEIALGLRGPDSLPRQIPPRDSYPSDEEEERFYRVQEQNQYRPPHFW